MTMVYHQEHPIYKINEELYGISVILTKTFMSSSGMDQLKTSALD
jgi:hypothetical protein